MVKEIVLVDSLKGPHIRNVPPLVEERRRREREAATLMDRRTPLQLSKDMARLFRLDPLYIPMMTRWKALSVLAEMQRQGAEIIW